jgi:hypothetical protein
VKILVMANPRSGTLSMTNMLRKAGYDVRHERQGEQGTVSCFFFKRALYYPREKLTAKRHLNERFNIRDFSHVYHLVRNPLHCIPSMAKVVGVGHRVWLHDIGVVNQDIKPKIKWAAHAWLHTELAIMHHTQARIIRIEDVRQRWPRELNRPTEFLHQHRGSGTRKSSPLTWSLLRDVAGETVAREITILAKLYGYSTREDA